MSVSPLNRNLEQELSALLRGVSLECLVCGEFVLHRRSDICCPECGMTIAMPPAATETQLELGSQAG